MKKIKYIKKSLYLINNDIETNAGEHYQIIQFIA